MERNYATQMDAARRGIVTPELKKVAEKEYMAHLHRSGGHRLDAAHENQCKSRCFERL